MKGSLEYQHKLDDLRAATDIQYERSEGAHRVYFGESIRIYL